MRESIVNFIVSFYGSLTRGFNEAKWKHKLRSFIFKFKPFIHKEFVVNKGDYVVLVGCPRPKVVENCLKLCGSKGRVVVIEANPENVRKQKTYFEKKAYQNINIVHTALSNETGKGVFLIAPQEMDHKLLIEGIDMDIDYIEHDYYLEKVEIELNTLDNIAARINLDRIDYIEITVNGAEFSVLQGMEKMLQVTERLFVKAHAIIEATGKPLNTQIAPFLQQKDFQTFITKPTASGARIKDWGLRQGDVYAWRSYN